MVIHYNVARTAMILTDVQDATRTCRWTDTHLQGFNQCKELINNSEVIQPWYNTREEPEYLICNAIDIGLASLLAQGTLARIRPTRFHSGKFIPAQLSYPTLQKELLAIIDSLRFLEAQLPVIKFTIPTNHKPLETFMDGTEASQELRRWQEFL